MRRSVAPKEEAAHEGIIGGVGGVCLAILRGAILAAIGGAVGASIFKAGPAATGA